MTMWYEIPGWPGYRISTEAEVLSLLGDEPTLKSTQLDDNGYWRVTLSRDSKEHHLLLHKLMALVFLPAPEEGMEVCHTDGNSANIAISNLRWDFPKGNIADAIRQGTHHSVHEANRTQCDNGHDFTEDNIIWRWGHGGKASGVKYRMCRKCFNKRMREYRQRRKAGLTPTPPLPRNDAPKPKTEAEWDEYLAKVKATPPA